MKKTMGQDTVSGPREKNEPKLSLGMFPVFPDPTKRPSRSGPSYRVLLGRVPGVLTGKQGSRLRSDTNKSWDPEPLAA